MFALPGRASKLGEMKRLNRFFFMRPTLQVAQELLGKILVFGSHCGWITETEAYVGTAEDPACHAARGKTKRTEVMFGPAGFSYVYFIYGMYHCFNIVTEREDFPAAVLIRSIQLITPPQKMLDGPGKLCRFLGVTRAHNSVDLTQSSSFYVKDSPYHPTFEITPRIGISQAQDHLWRFVVQNMKGKMHRK